VYAKHRTFEGLLKSQEEQKFLSGDLLTRPYLRPVANKARGSAGSRGIVRGSVPVVIAVTPVLVIFMPVPIMVPIIWVVIVMIPIHRRGVIQGAAVIGGGILAINAAISPAISWLDGTPGGQQQQCERTQ
jgi:hypothetical protein